MYYYFLLKKTRCFVTVDNIAAWTITFVVFILFVALFKTVGPEFLGPQHTAIFFVPTILSEFIIIKDIPKKNTLIIWTVITIFFYSTNLYIIYKPMAKLGDWERVASYIMATEKPSQAILAFDQEVAMTLAYYYSGPNAIVPLPKEQDFRTYDLSDFVLRDEQEILTALSNVPGNHEFLWLVNQTDCIYLDVDYNCWILEKFVSKYYSVELSKNFFPFKGKIASPKVKFSMKKPVFTDWLSRIAALGEASLSSLTRTH